MTHRSGKTKTTKNSNEAEYRIIFDNLISDLLVVLYWPEWPAASLLLSIACKYMVMALYANCREFFVDLTCDGQVSSLDDVKLSSQTDNNAARTIALDHLGIIAARIRSSVLKVQRDETSSQKFRALKPMDEVKVFFS